VTPAAGAVLSPWKNSTRLWRITSSTACCCRAGLRKSCPRFLTGGEERTERHATHIAELRKRASEADAKLKRLYDAIENGVTDLSDLMLKDRITELKAIRDQARADTERAEGAIERKGPTITPQSIKTFAITARKRMRIEGGGYRRDYLARSPSASRSMRKNFASWA
jgi:hypothetical protein